jgi:GT2 family glycosyltransferase
MKNKPLVYVVTPVFNSIWHTRNFLLSLKQQSYNNFKVVIVDDGSTDGTYEMIIQEFKDVIVIKGDGNLWWSGGTNLGVKRALKDNANFVLTINNDVLLGKSYISRLVNAAIKNSNSIIGSVVVYNDKPKSVWYAGATFDKKTGNLQHRTGTLNDFSGIVESEWLTGMGVLIPVTVFKKIGFYDSKNYPQYFGDAEFSIRAKVAGFKLLVDTSCVLTADLNSNWVNKSLSLPRITFLKDLFLSKRSPYQISKRVKFYNKYWPYGKISALSRIYLIELIPVYRSWFIAYSRKIIKRSKK